MIEAGHLIDAVRAASVVGFFIGGTVKEFIKNLLLLFKIPISYLSDKELKIVKQNLRKGKS
jgi:hypothetical protein